MINDIVHHLDLRKQFAALIKTFSVHIPTIIEEMKMSPNKVLARNGKRCTTLLVE